MVSNTSTPGYKPIFAPLSNSSTSDEVSSFRIVSYNVLAQSYVKSANFPHSPSPCLRWKARSKALLERLLSFRADILCLQELDEFDSFFKGQLDSHGYSSIYVKRPGKKKDGCGIFYRRACISLMESEVIQYNDLVPQVGDSSVDPNACAGGASSNDESRDIDRGDPNDPRVRLKRDCVGIIAAFRTFHALDRTFIIANTHIYWDPDWVDVKLAQAKHLVARVSRFQSLLSNEIRVKIPVVICGDFNSTPGDQVYSYLTSADQSLADNAATLSADQGCLPLCSLYASVKEEPDFTNCTPEFTGTLDYIFFSSFDTLKPVSLLEIPLAEAEDVKGGLPNYYHPSDHLPIGTDCLIVA
ncbi:hypothetical protein L7F22_044438 [Adiantum nelumboides]|nr:hypothetical protein [Adiantum nelumboides]